VHCQGRPEGIRNVGTSQIPTLVQQNPLRCSCTVNSIIWLFFRGVAVGLLSVWPCGWCSAVGASPETFLHPVTQVAQCFLHAFLFGALKAGAGDCGCPCVWTMLRCGLCTLCCSHGLDNVASVVLYGFWYRLDYVVILWSELCVCLCLLL
jgi:hypothetical protein